MRAMLNQKVNNHPQGTTYTPQGGTEKSAGLPFITGVTSLGHLAKLPFRPISAL